MIRDQLTSLLRAAADANGLTVDAVHLEQPANRTHGDFSSNIALASAKLAGRAPRDLAQCLVDWINDHLPPVVDEASVAGPGFVNFRLNNSWLTAVVDQVLDQGVERYAASEIGAGQRVMVEFVSANPTGPLHAGHARNAFYGDAVARLLKRSGYEVFYETYVNDRGSQVDHYAASLVARKRGEDLAEDGYRGDYITEWAAEMPDDADPVLWGLERAEADQADVLASVGIVFDKWFSERSLLTPDDDGENAITRTLADLRASGHVFEADGATWLRSTDMGDDKDRVLVKSDGTFPYFLPDIAYHRDKFDRGFDTVIDVWGADHHGYVVRSLAAMEALGIDPSRLELRLTQLVKLLRDGQEITLSKRAGSIIEMREVIEEVGADAARVSYLLQSIDTPQTIDLAVAAAQSMDNPVYYMQMAHTRMCSITRVAAERGVVRAPRADVDLSALTHPREAEAMRALYELPATMALAVADRAPHRLTAWLRTTAAATHAWYHDCPVLADSVPEDVRQARLWLAEALRIGLRVGLDTLGVSAPERMDSLAETSE